jgi:hypothetical protein
MGSAPDTTWPRRSALLAALGLVLWIAFFLAPAFAPGRALLGVDLLMRFPPWDARVAPEWEARNHLLFDQAVQFYPWRLLTRTLSAAHLPPLWNPYAGTGSPLLANYQSATLAPVEVLVSGLDPTRAPAVAAAIRLAIAGAGMLLLLHRFGLPALAASFGTLGFLGSGAITILLYHPNSNVSVWLPFVALLSYDLARTPRGGSRIGTAGLLTLVLGAQLLGGHPETSLYVSLASGLFFLFGLAGLGAPPASDTRGSAGAVGLLIAAHIFSAAIAAPQILPSLEYLRAGAVLEHRGGVRFFNPPLCAVGLVVPEIFGSPERPNTYFGPRNYHAVATQYAGMATLFLALFAVVTGARRRGLTATLGATLVLALLLVYPTPIWRLAGHVPLFRVSANVTGLTLLAAFLMAILGACGLATWTAGGEASTGRRGGSWLPILAGLLGAGMLVAWICLPLAGERIFALGSEKLRALYEGVTHAKPIEYYLGRLPLVFETVRGTLFRTGLMAAILAFLLATVRRTRGANGGAGAAGLVAIGLLGHLAHDLGSFGRGYVPAIERSEVFPATSEIDTLAALPGLVRVLPTGRTTPPNMLTAFEIEDFRVHDAIGSAAHQRLETAMSQAPFMRRPLASYDRALLDVAGVDIVLDDSLGAQLDHPIDGAGDPAITPTILAPWVQGRITLLRNPNAWPRAMFCTTAHEAASDSAALAAAHQVATEHPGIPPDAVAITAPRSGTAVAPDALWGLVERLWPGDGASLARLGTVGSPPVGPIGQLRHGQLRHGPLRVLAEIDAPRAGWLVLLDQDYPGWRVLVDGQPASAARAFGLYRAVEVPAGRHTIAWDYRPASFAIGLALALPALAISLLAGAQSLVGRPRR